MNSILVLPSRETGRGGGHLFRSIELVKSLRAGGADALLYAEEDEISNKKWSCIVLDRFRTKQDELERWIKLGPVIGIDEGESRDSCDFLIDLLPSLPYKNKTAGQQANLCSPSLLPLPKNRSPSFDSHNRKDEPLKILISFGAEDTAAFTVDTALALKKATGTSLTCVLGPLRKNNDADQKLLEEAGITVIRGELPFDTQNKDSDFNLKESLADYDWIITHFGITAFEALYARVPVLLINPGAYHEKLSRHAGLPTVLSLEKLQNNCIDYYMASIRKSEAAARRWGLENSRQPETLAALLLNAKPVVHRHCPLCGTPRGTVAGRFPGRTYRRCSCGVIIMDSLAPSPIEYNRDYFFAEYQKQYGKTYLEDFPKLQKDGVKRLHNINAVFDLKRNAPKNNDGKKLLDIGCAYGPFLAAAHSEGFEVTGIDPAPEAVEYVKKNLGLNAIQGTFLESLTKIQAAGKDNQLFDAITLWYVIEHFEEPGKVLAAVNGLLKTGGVLAFSTPSAAGISARKSLAAFLENSPADHVTIWDPRRAAAVLKRYGFKLKKRVITGHHPERFPRFAAAHFPKVCFALSRIFGLGDTFEVYAVKLRNCGEQNG